MAVPDPSGRSSWPAFLSSRGAMGAALFLATVAVYAQVGGHPFVSFDDPQYVARNDRVLRGLSWDNVSWALGTLHFSNWHPLTWLSYMLDVSLFGPGNPAAMHLVNVALHAANGVLLFLALDASTRARVRSALVAAVWALHPTRVESVAWIAERKDVLFAAFGFLALLAWERYARRPSARAYALVVVAFAASLASKAMLVTLPFVLLLLDVWPLGRVWSPFVLRQAQHERMTARDSRISCPPVSWRRAVLEKLPLLAMSAAVAAASALAQSRAGAVSDLTVWERLSNAVVAYVRYVGTLLWPVDLAVVYPHPLGGQPAWQVAGAGAALVALTAGAVLALRTRPWLAVGWLWFLGTLVPVIGLVQLGAQAMADRYTYFPTIGLLVALAWSVPSALPAAVRRALPWVAAALLVALGALTVRQVGYWKDDETLYRHAIAVTGPNFRAQALLALHLREKGRLGEAFEHMLEANRILPGSPQDLLNLGIVARDLGRMDVAERSMRSAVEAGPRYVPGWYGLADLLRRTGRPGEAIEAFRQVVRVQPEHGLAWSELGIQLHLAGRTEEAGAAFAEAVRVAPSDPLVQRNAGVFHAIVGAWPRAVEAFSRADQLKPGDPDVLRRLGVAQAEAGDRAAALRTADRLAPLDPRGAAAVRVRAGSVSN